MPSNARATHLTRRGLLAAGGALGLGAALVACGGGKDSKDSSSGGNSGPWKFTDDRGKAVDLKSVPKNIVAFTGTAAALYDYGVEVKAVFGPTTVKDPKTGKDTADIQAGDLDITKVEILGNTWGEFNIEQYVKLAPEVLISAMWEKDTLWYLPPQSADKILKVAPSVALWAAQTTMPKALQRHAELAESLGADLKAKKAVDAKARFEKAAARLRAAAKSKPEIRVMIGSASQELFYVSLAKTSADTLYFEELGVKFVQPKVNAAGFFEELSWENLDTYPADVIMMDNRTSAIQPGALTSKPTWGQLPAVKAGQVIPRVTEPIYSYDKCAVVLEDLAKAIENAKKVA
ncbi:ABC transporter substrate-binding protein [Streptomyces sp. SP18CS02]|uniref:ABC transporter substrate-binding protein n=1 Tax=Streptomyces sp. SP18CS02 TaxID=3002531 RepID=UPI002E79EC94|nr:ABC transporter substrate-binding protein [Streptomyces sp. SP18CS02]MEE1753735.1 ABC transporter substrate-binding protein [Streptomyces sp. SP18CS02]